ncbi:MAG: PKD domain-containing protein [Gammaproteobacteria bacterium]
MVTHSLFSSALKIIFGFFLLIYCLLVVGIILSQNIAANPGANEVTFAAIGDYGDASSAERDVTDLINSWGVDYIIGLGDNRYGSISFDTAVGQFFCDYLTDVEMGDFCDGGNSLSNAFFPALGNHEYSDGGGLIEYLNYFTLPGSGIPTTGTSGTERYYDVVQGPVHMFVIDSDEVIRSEADMAAQQAWLQHAMAASTTPWQIVVTHHAPYSSARHGPFTEVQWPYAEWGADAVLAAHDHVYERLSADGIPYFVNGIGGRSIYAFETILPNSELRYNDDYGAMRITANTESVTFEFLNRSGTLIDRHTIGEGANNNVGIVNVRVAQSSDDAEELVDASPSRGYATGHVTVNNSDLELGEDTSWHGGAQEVGIRFQNIDIPQGATINTAWLEFIAEDSDNDPTMVTIRAQDSDNAATFTNTAFNISDRPDTSASVDWTIEAWSSTGVQHFTPELATVVQEVVDRAGWQANNSMAFLIAGSGIRSAESWNGSASKAPLLHVEFSLPGSANQLPNADFDFIITNQTAAFSDMSSDSDGGIVSWYWDFGDGNNSTVQNPTHTYATDNSYTVTLTVTDDYGDDASTSAAVAVTAIDMVEIDIQPYLLPNEVLPASDNPIIVAVLGGSTEQGDPVNFDAESIDASSLRFGPASAETQTINPLIEDVDSDGIADAIYVFGTQDTGILCDDTEATLTGQTTLGQVFEDTDSIVTLDCETTGCHP